MRRVLLVLLLVVACKKHEQVAPKAGSGSAVVAAPGDAAVAAPGLTFDTGDDADEGIAAAFQHHVPRLPAISADGAVVADYESDATGPSIPLPMDVTLRKVGASEVDERLPIVDDAMAADGEREGSAWPSPKTAETLHARAAAVIARLRGFHSLTKIDLAVNSNGEPQPTKIGDLTLTAETADDSTLRVTLTGAKGELLHREELAPYHGEARDAVYGGGTCEYRPSLNDAYRDPANPRQILVEIGHRTTEDCLAWQRLFLPFSTEPGPEAPVAVQFDVVGVNSTDPDSVLAPDAVFVTSGQVTDDIKLVGVAERAMDYSDTQAKHVDVTLSRDGKSAWASELATVTLLETNQPGKDRPWRASDVLIKTPAGWRIAVAAWTEPVANGKANAEAKSGKLTAGKLDGDPGDQSLRDAFAKLATDGVDATAAARDDLVAIGSGPGERTVGGAAFARAWNAAWKGKTTVVSSIAHTTPSGTTGWVAATIELAKPGYKLPFTVFAVFDKAADGTWTLVHIHFAV